MDFRRKKVQSFGKKSMVTVFMHNPPMVVLIKNNLIGGMHRIALTIISTYPLWKKKRFQFNLYEIRNVFLQVNEASTSKNIDQITQPR